MANPIAAPAEDIPFAATRWTLVARAADADPARARSALRELCLQYWPSVYAYLRRCGHPPAAAADLAAAFFGQLVQARMSLAAARRWPMFREYLLDALHRFLAVEGASAEVPAVPLQAVARPDPDQLERRYRSDTATATPQQAFHRSYALQLIASAHRRLRMEATHAGREAMFAELAPLLAAAPQAGGLEAIARRLSTRPMVVSIALGRLRQRFQELVREELAQTVSDARALSAERVELLAVLR